MTSKFLSPLLTLSPDLLIGRRLLRSETPGDIRSVVDLTSEFTEPSWEAQRVMHVPILDAASPGPASLLSTAQAINELPTPVYIHCAQGHGRTATVAAACLIVNDRMSLKDALSVISDSRPGARPNREQYAALSQLSRTIDGSY